MKRKLLLSTLLGVLAVSHVVAGDSYCPPAPAKCPVECSPDNNGRISMGYDTDYILYGVRHLRDNVWADVNYTFDCLPVPVTIGARHITGLGSTAATGNWDESDLYVSVDLPGFCGFNTSWGYIHRFYPTRRLPTGAPNQVGDSRGEFWVTIERELFCGINALYRRAYDRNQPSAMFQPGTVGNAVDEGAWVHTLGLEKDFCLTDCVGLSLAGGVLYSDNYWPSAMSAGAHTRSSGWNSYYLKAALPISLNCNATLTPYIGYNGSPDSWIADGVDLLPGGGNNANDIFHGGVSLEVSF